MGRMKNHMLSIGFGHIHRNSFRKNTVIVDERTKAEYHIVHDPVRQNGEVTLLLQTPEQLGTHQYLIKTILKEAFKKGVTQLFSPARTEEVEELPPLKEAKAKAP